LLVIGAVTLSAGFAAFAFYDPIQAAYFAHAEKIIGAPVPWQFNFQHAFSDTERDLYRFHNFLLGINIVIFALVATLLIAAVYLFRASRHPVPNPVTHNTALEVVWTVLPVILLIAIALWSFRLPRKADFPPSAGATTLEWTMTSRQNVTP